MDYILETDRLCKRYRNFTALNGLDMHIPGARSMASSEETAQARPRSSASSAAFRSRQTAALRCTVPRTPTLGSVDAAAGWARW